MLLKKREKKQDLAHPTNWLVKAKKTDIENILMRWDLPQGYAEFLDKASPLNADFKIKGYGAVDVYGAHELIERQAGYSYHPNTKEALSGWNHDYIVIASCHGDPFCIDIRKEDSPVYFALHGVGTWEFTEEFESLLAFLKSLS